MIVLSLSQEQPREGKLSPGWGEQGSAAQCPGSVPAQPDPAAGQGRAGQKKLLNLFGSSSSFSSSVSVAAPPACWAVLPSEARAGSWCSFLPCQAFRLGILDVTCLRS